ncbi:MAG: endospore germination permease [Limnochordia bacterium]|nr:endospore germination permease [Limnochordia bacterium]
MKESVPDRQGIALVALFLIGNSFIYGVAGRAGRDLWLSFLLAIVIALPLIILYARLHSLMYGRTLSQALTELFGKWPSRVVALGYSLYAWHLACLVIGDLTEFVQTTSLTQTPQVVVAAGFATLVLWAVKYGTEVLARWSSVMIIVVVSILLATLALMWSEVSFGEFLPVMYDGFEPVLLGALQVLDFPILETVLLFWILDALTEKKSSYKVLLSGFFIASLFLMVMASVSLSVLGTEKYVTSYFPIFMATARIDLASFLTRMELVVGITFAIGGFLKIAVCVLAASKALAHALGFDNYRFLVTPLALGVIPGSQWFVQTIMGIEENATKVASPADLLMKVILPVLLWITAEIRMSRQGKNKAGKPNSI